MGGVHLQNALRHVWDTIGCAQIAQARYNDGVNDDTLRSRALEHPLPAGLRDLLAEETFYRRALGRKILEHFALHAYDLVTPPAFELAEVLEKGLGTLDPGDVLRFVEPESGEVCALRPDMTPQIARMVATRLSSQPGPIRLCYEGTIVRRRQGRARKHRQVPQTGVELLGAPAPRGDEEVLRLLASVSRCIGLESFVIDVGHAGISRSLVEALPRILVPEMTEALVHKDRARVEGLLSTKEGESVPAGVARAIEALPDLCGGFTGRSGSEVLTEAKKVFQGTPAESALEEVTGLWEKVGKAREGDSGVGNEDLGGVLRVDLGEVRHLAYYTGIIFHAIAPGPGEPYASGGRYDDLLGRFGSPMSAIGFALHVDAVSQARGAAGVFDTRPARVLVAMGVNGAAVVRELRAKGMAATETSDTDGAMRYARAHGYTHVVRDAGADRVKVNNLHGPGTEIVVHRDEIWCRMM